MKRFFASLDRTERTLLLTASPALAVLAALFVAGDVPELAFLPRMSRDAFLVGFPLLAILSAAIVFYYTTFRDILRWMQKFLLLWTPAIAVFAGSWSLSESIPSTAKAATSFFILFSGIVFFASIIRKERELFHDGSAGATSFREWIRKQGTPTLLFVLMLTGVFFSFASYRLGQFAAVDEALWLYGRVPKYWNAVENLEFSKTNISDKPGITTAIVSGIGLLQEPAPAAYANVYGSDQGIERFFAIFRFPIVVFATILLPLFYFLLERLGGRTRALFAYTLIALSPVTLGMTKIINPDSFLWLFAPLSLLSYFVYLKRRHLSYLLLAGALLGLALLTKYVANIVFVFLLGVLFAEYAFLRKDEPFFRYMRRSLLSYALFTFVALSTFLALFPAVWLRPEKILDATILSQAFESTSALFLGIFAAIIVDRLFTGSRATTAALAFIRKHASVLVSSISAAWVGLVSFVALNTWFGMRIYDFPTLLAAPKTIAEQAGFFGIYASNLYPLLFGIIPIAFATLFVAPFLLLRKDIMRTWTGRVIFYSLLFILLYYLGTTVNGVGAITRYQIILFPIAAVIAGFVLGELFLSAKKRFFEHASWSRFALPGAVFVVFASGLFTLAVTPFPLSYASSLLQKAYHTDVKDMGPGSYLAAEYLNGLPNAEHLTIWTDKSGVCKFFNGNCKSGFSWENYKDETFSYIVVSAGRESRTSRRVNEKIENTKPNVIRFDTYYGRTEGAVWEALINGRPTHYVKIYPFEK